MTLKSDANFEETLICCFKNNKNLVNFDLTTQNSQYFYFYWFLLYKVYNITLKKYRGVIFHDTAFKGDAKFKEKLTCDMKNDITNLANFHKSTWKSQSWDFNEILWLKVENA